MVHGVIESIVVQSRPLRFRAATDILTVGRHQLAMPHTDHIAELATFDVVAKAVDNSSFRAVNQTLLERFFSNVKRATGKWVFNGYRWHAYSFGHESAKKDEAALKAYQDRHVMPFYVYFEFDDQMFDCSAVQYPDIRPLNNDIYVFPHRVNWLFVTTHEMSMGLGPYFALPSA